MRWLWLVALVSCGSGPDPATPAGMIYYGARWVGQRGCAKCHDDGHGTLGGSLAPVGGQPDGILAYGGNLTPDVKTGLGAWSDEQIIRGMRDGWDNAGETMCAAMPRFEEMGDVEARDIVAYLRSLPPVVRAIPPSMCPERMPDLGVPAPPPDLAAPGGFD